MLKLLIFAPCEKVILGEDKSTSLIGLLEALEVGISTSEDLPLDAAAPLQWHVLALWQRTESVNEDIQYQQRIEVVRPDGHVAGWGMLEFTVTDKHENFRNVLKMPAIPIGVAGRCLIKVSLRRIGGPDLEWHEFGQYPLRIIHKKVEPQNA